MSFLSDPESPALFKASVNCYKTLVEKTTPQHSEKRFGALSEIISSNIVGGAWIYGAKSTEVIEASVETLGPLVKSLGIGSVRFLKVRNVSKSA